MSVILVSLAATLMMSAWAGDAANDTPECQCRDREGVRVDLGSVDCFDISGSRSLYRCEMSTNTPYWKRVGNQEGCPQATPESAPPWLTAAFSPHLQ